MKRFFSIVLLLLLLLAACAPGGGEGKCSKGVCVKVRTTGAIKKNSSIPVVIKVKTDKDRPEMHITFENRGGSIIEETADKSDVVYWWKEGVGTVIWEKNMQAGKEITITQNVLVQGSGSYTFVAKVFLPGGGMVSDGVVLRITEEGGTAYVFDTPIPEITAFAPTVSPGPSPTFLPTDEPTTAAPTQTPSPLPSITEPAYP